MKNFGVPTQSGQFYLNKLVSVANTFIFNFEIYFFNFTGILYHILVRIHSG